MGTSGRRQERRRGGGRWAMGLLGPGRGFARGASLRDRSFLRQDDGGAGGDGRGGGAGEGGGLRRRSGGAAGERGWGAKAAEVAEVRGAPEGGAEGAKAAREGEGHAEGGWRAKGARGRWWRRAWKNQPTDTRDRALRRISIRRLWLPSHRLLPGRDEGRGVLRVGSLGGGTPASSWGS